jgi:hypothetical protein
MTDKGREAHNKGERDFKKSGGLADSNPLTEAFHPTYDPPSGYEEEYKEGWDNAKNQKE